MARKIKPTDCLKPCKADEVFQRIRAWHQAENPSPEELIEWLSGVSEKLTNTVSDLHANKDQICQCDELTRLKASSMVLNSLDFLERAEVAAELMTGAVGGRVRDAFVEGLRCGLLYEKIMSLIDGRYSDHWMLKDGRQAAAKKTNAKLAAKRAEDHQDFVVAVRYAMETWDLKYHPACAWVAGQFDVSKRCVVDNTQELAPNRNRKNA
jgi:hypothetical protein